MKLRLAIASALLLGVALLGATPAGAIESASFGIDTTGGSGAGAARKLELKVRAGGVARDEVRVWNKTPEPMRVRLSVAPAQVDKAGTASLGGDPAAAGWVDLDAEDVLLAPHEARTVAFEVRPPRELSAGTKTLAVLAEPVAKGGSAPAVLQRLAVMAYLNPDGALSASLGWLPLAALAALLALAAGVVVTALRKRDTALQWRPGFLPRA